MCREVLFLEHFPSNQMDLEDLMASPRYKNPALCCPVRVSGDKEMLWHMKLGGWGIWGLGGRGREFFMELGGSQLH